jgi:hypothetical protein
MVAPRYCSVAPHVSSLGPRAVALAASAGLIADDWQEFVTEKLLGLDQEDRFVHFEGGVNVARQNGKDGILEIIELDALVNWPGQNLVIHSAHEFATAQEHQLRLESLFQNTPELHALVKDKGGYKHANGQESINLKSGSRIIFKARTKGGAIGFSADLLVWNEAMMLPDAVVGAMMPTLRASDAPYGPLIIYAGTAVDQDIHVYGINWARIRERGIAGEPGLAYFEWSAHLDVDRPDELTDAQLNDRTLWLQANPALGKRIDPEHMAREIASMATRVAAVQLFGVGDWPATDGAEDTLISSQDWADCEEHDWEFVDPVIISFDISPDRRTSICVSGRTDRGQMGVEVINHAAGTGWVFDRLSSLYQNHEVAEVVCDGYGPAAAIASQLDEAGITIRRLDSADYGKACGLFVNMVGEKTLRHLGQDELSNAIKGAKPRPLVDRWAWSRTNSLVDISPLVAATLALYSAIENDVGTVAIY